MAVRWENIDQNKVERGVSWSLSDQLDRSGVDQVWEKHDEASTESLRKQKTEHGENLADLMEQKDNLVATLTNPSLDPYEKEQIYKSSSQIHTILDEYNFLERQVVSGETELFQTLYDTASQMVNEVHDAVSNVNFEIELLESNRRLRAAQEQEVQEYVVTATTLVEAMNDFEQNDGLLDVDMLGVYMTEEQVA